MRAAAALSCAALAAALAGAAAARAEAPAPLGHAAWTRLLERYVDDAGQVAYRRLAAEDRPALDGYLAALAAARPAPWPRDAQLAFWLNAYNAAIVDAVLRGRTAESLLARYRLFYGFEIEVAGETRTPDAIENRVIRPSGEPRIHFALVCASTSCPVLRRQAWQAATLDADLDDATRRFLADPVRNRIRAGADRVGLSSIFKWFRDDFGGSDDSVRAFVARHVADPERAWLLEAQPPIDYLDYDWSLNAQPGERPG